MQIIISAILVCGVIFSFAGSIGLVRFPDAYCRMHALAKGVTMGVICIMLGSLCFFYYVNNEFSAKNLLVIIFIMLTTPAGSHMISRAAYHYGVPLCKSSIRDDFEEDIVNTSDKNIF